MAVYYVSPTGNDASSGTSLNSAFATLSAAVKAMAASGSADTTYVLDGTYYLNGAGLSLTNANSNDTIAAYQGAKPVISGGNRALDRLERRSQRDLEHPAQYQ